MLRNREVKILLLIMCVISLVAIIVAATFSFKAFLLTIVTTSLLISSTFVFTKCRYREIEKLSAYLRKIIGGEYTLDIRDNSEGELSILKNDIYKVTLMLSEHSTLLKRDKKHLTDAIADISHQLKTPLTSMMVLADILKDSKISDSKRKEFTHKLHVQLERIEWLVSSLLKLSKIDAGTVEFKRESINVKLLIEKALEPVLIPIDIKEHRVSLIGEDSVAFFGDLNWTVEAILNILKNCVEHTPERGVITITYSENSLFTEIVISDSGIGILKEDIPHIFKRFYKGKNASEDSIGIGLAMSHSIITSQNGNIYVVSEDGIGTKFIIKFYKQIV